MFICSPRRNGAKRRSIGRRRLRCGKVVLGPPLRIRRCSAQNWRRSTRAALLKVHITTESRQRRKERKCSVSTRKPTARLHGAESKYYKQCAVEDQTRRVLKPAMQPRCSPCKTAVPLRRSNRTRWRRAETLSNRRIPSGSDHAYHLSFMKSSFTSGVYGQMVSACICGSSSSGNSLVGIGNLRLLEPRLLRRRIVIFLCIVVILVPALATVVALNCRARRPLQICRAEVRAVSRMLAPA